MLTFFSLALRYSVVMDSVIGETRAGVYQWNEDESIPHVTCTGTTTTPKSLIEAARDLSVVSTILTPLLEWAKTKVPAESRPDTDIHVLGTTAMRTLEKDVQTQIMDEARRVLVEDKSFKVIDGACSVLSAVDEAGLEWVATNVALNRMNAESRLNRLSMLSIGSQYARFASEIEVSDTLIDEYVYTIKYSSKKFLLFLSPFQGLGIDEAIISHAVALASHAGVATVESPCFLTGWSQTFDSITVKGRGNYSACVSTLGEILNKPDCGAENCMFDGVPRVIYNGIVGLESLYDAREFFGMEVNATLSEYDAKAREFCAKSFTDVQAQYPDRADAYIFCFAVAYQNYFLREGLGVTDEVYVARLKEYDGQTISFPLGVPLTGIFPSQMIREPLKWYEILIVVLVFAAFGGVIIGIIVCCCVAWRQRVRERNRIVLLESHWQEAELEDDPEADKRKPADERVGDAFLRVCGMMSDTKFVDFDAQAHEKATNALGSLPGRMAPQIGDGVMHVEYVKTDAEKGEDKMREGFDRVGQMNLREPRLARQKLEDAVNAGFESMMQADLNQNVELEKDTMHEAVVDTFNQLNPELRMPGSPADIEHQRSASSAKSDKRQSPQPKRKPGRMAQSAKVPPRRKNAK